MVITEVKLQGLVDRYDRANALVKNGKVHRLLETPGDQYVVESDGGGFYLIMDSKCPCKGSQMKGRTFRGLCKHVLAVDLFKEVVPPEPEPDETEESEEDREARLNEALFLRLR